MSAAPPAPTGPPPERDLQREPHWLAAGEAILLAVLTVLTRLPSLHAPPFMDELNHVFAARSLLERGALEIVPGAVYVRAWPFTYLVAGSFSLLGDGMVAARLPSLLTTAALVAALFLWVRREGGRIAAWSAALLFCFTPVVIEFSRLARFYTLYALVFWIGAVLVYRITTAGGMNRPTLLRGIGAIACFSLAQRLHLTAPIGVATLALWVLLVRGRDGLRLVRKRRAARVVALLGLVLLGALAVITVRSGQFAIYVRLFKYADLWAADEVGNHYYYLQYMGTDWPTIWTIFPVLAVVALWYRPRAAWFCLVIFGAAFGVHSLAAWKNIRYLFYALPMYYAVVGFAAGAILPWLHRAFTQFLLAHIAPLRGNRQDASVISLVGLVAALAFGLLQNPAVDLIGRDLASRKQNSTGWGAAQALTPLLDSSSVFVASSGLDALYTFKRVDYELLATDLKSFKGDRTEFTVSPVFGRPMVSTAESLGRIMACYPTGLVLVEKDHWRKQWAVTPDVATYLVQHADSLALPAAWRMIGFRWKHRTDARPGECPPERSAAVSAQ